MRAPVIVVIIIAVSVGCSSSKSSNTTSAGPSQEPAKVIQISGLISAANGGTLAFDNGTTIEFPPGALREDTNVTFSRLEDRAYDTEALVAAAKLEPDGLVLERPEALTLKYTQTPTEGDAALSLASVSKANDLRKVTGEINPYQLVPSTIDPSTKTVQASVDHFSWFSVNPMPLVHLALELPGKYLHNGDIVYALTGGVDYTDASAFPMHVGVFVEDASRDTIVESTLPDEDCTPNYFQGVASERRPEPCRESLRNRLAQQPRLGPGEYRPVHDRHRSELRRARRRRLGGGGNQHLAHPRRAPLAA
jgi:hypothetical protein